MFLGILFACKLKEIIDYLTKFNLDNAECFAEFSLF